jgi:hypothetical protein
MPIEPEPVTGTTTRQRYEQHSVDPACSGCHRLIDPIGFGLEHYDPIGRFRTTDDGRAVDASGEVVDSETAGGPFVGAVELAERLAESQEVADCAVRQWFRYAFGRDETDTDAATLAALRDAFVASGLDLVELMRATALTRAFVHKPVP